MNQDRTLYERHMEERKVEALEAIARALELHDLTKLIEDQASGLIYPSSERMNAIGDRSQKLLDSMTKGAKP